LQALHKTSGVISNYNALSEYTMHCKWKRTTKTTYKSWLTTDPFVRLHNNTMALWQVLLCPHRPCFPISSQRLLRFGWNLVLDTHEQRKQKNYLPDLAGLSLFKQFQAFATGLQVFNKLTKWLAPTAHRVQDLRAAGPRCASSPTSALLQQQCSLPSPPRLLPSQQFLAPSRMPRVESSLAIK
jgi:hypothetical protein